MQEDQVGGKGEEGKGDRKAGGQEGRRGPKDSVMTNAPIRAGQEFSCGSKHLCQKVVTSKKATYDPHVLCFLLIGRNSSQIRRTSAL